MHDIWNAGFEYPAMAALKIFERRGYKVSVKKVPGPLKNRRRQPGLSGPKSANSPRPWSVRDEDGLPRNIPPCTQIAELQFTPFSGGLGIWSWDRVVLGRDRIGDAECGFVLGEAVADPAPAAVFFTSSPAIRAMTELTGAGMSVDRINTIEWNGTELSGWIMINGASTKVSAGRDTIHTHARGFDDALTWEINRHRVEIFEKLVPFFQRTASTQAQ